MTEDELQVAGMKSKVRMAMVQFCRGTMKSR
jgi:hypothetical protein